MKLRDIFNKRAGEVNTEIEKAFNTMKDVEKKAEEFRYGLTPGFIKKEILTLLKEYKLLCTTKGREQCLYPVIDNIAYDLKIDKWEKDFISIVDDLCNMINSSTLKCKCCANG